MSISQEGRVGRGGWGREGNNQILPNNKNNKIRATENHINRLNTW